MHFEVLVEDLSGKIALEQLLEKILGANYTRFILGRFARSIED